MNNNNIDDNKIFESVDISYETLDKAEKTLHSLVEQNDKIDNIRKHIDNSEYNLNISEILLNKMSSLGNRIKYYIFDLEEEDKEDSSEIKNNILTNNGNKIYSAHDCESEILLKNLKNIKNINCNIGNILYDQNIELKKIKNDISNLNLNINRINHNINDKLLYFS